MVLKSSHFYLLCAGLAPSMLRIYTASDMPPPIFRLLTLNSIITPSLPLHRQTISTFNAAADLFGIFEQILSEVHTVSSSSTGAFREQLVAKLDKELEEWQNALGPKCKYPLLGDGTPTRSLYLCHAVCALFLNILALSFPWG